MQYFYKSLVLIFLFNISIDLVGQILINKIISNNTNNLELPDLQVGVNIGELSMCNLVKRSGGWQKGNAWNSSLVKRSELDAAGYPLASTFTANAGILYFGNTSNNRASNIYPFLTDVNARYVLTWKGDCDAEMTNNAILVSGSKAERRKVYKISGGTPIVCIKLTAGTNYATDPLRDLAYWMPNPSNPAISTEGQSFSPIYLKFLTDQNSGVLRFMDPAITNASAQILWTDRRPKSHPQQGAAYSYSGNWCTNIVPGTATQTKDAGMAWEYFIDLCNATNKDMWINIPHAANDDYITKLALLIKGDDPDGTGQVGLNSNLRVWVEYSNEIWAGASAFPQGYYADSMATKFAISRPAFTARRSCETFKIFQRVFGGTNRLIRIAALWTANGGGYDQAYLNEIVAYGSTLIPAVKADVMAVTTYFGQGMENYVIDSIDYIHPTAQLYEKTFNEWEKKLLANKTSVTGRDVTGTISETFLSWSKQFDLPIVAYEGGAGFSLSNIVDYYDGVKGSKGPGMPGSDFTIATNATTGALRVVVESGTSDYTATNFNITGTKNICDNQWHQLAVVLPTGKSKVSDLLFYIDGVPDNTTIGLDGIINTVPDKKVRIGMSAAYNFQALFDGNIDDVLMYNRELNSTEISSVFSGSVPNNQLMARWQMNNNGVDSSGNNNNLFLKTPATFSTTSLEGSHSLLCKSSGTGYYGYAESENFQGIADSTARTIIAWVKTSVKGNVIISWGKPGVMRLEICLVAAEKYGQGDWNVGPYQTYIHNMLDHPRIKDMYKIWLALVKGQGIVTHSNFQDFTIFSKWGQWAMKDNLMESDEQAPRYAFIRDWSFQEQNIKEISNPVNKRPVFYTPETLPMAITNTPYNSIISYGEGDGDINIELLSSNVLPEGLTFSNEKNGIRITGIPTETGNFFLFYRIIDADKDPAYRIFTLPCVSRNEGSVLIDFEECIETPKSPSNSYAAEPLLSKGFIITSTGNTGGKSLRIAGPSIWGSNYKSKVAESVYWGSNQRIDKADGGYFDIASIDIKQTAGGSLKLTGTGMSNVNKVLKINTTYNVMQTIKLDWVGIKTLKIEYSSGENFVGNGGGSTGQIDNIRLNSTVSPINKQTENGTLTIPAQNHLNLFEGASNSNWTLLENSYLLSGPNNDLSNSTTYLNNISPYAEFYTEFTKTGTHYVWIEAFANQNGLDNAFHVGLDGTANTASENIKVVGNNEYVWTNKTATGNVAKINVYGIGLHKLNLWMNDDGAKLKQIVVTNDSMFVIPLLNTYLNDIKSTEIQIYPNPAKNIINLKTISDYPISEISVSDMLGRTLLKSLLIDNAGNYQVNVSTLKNGLYFVDVFDGQKKQTLKLKICK